VSVLPSIYMPALLVAQTYRWSPVGARGARGLWLLAVGEYMAVIRGCLAFLRPYGSRVDSSVLFYPLFARLPSATTDIREFEIRCSKDRQSRASDVWIVLPGNLMPSTWCMHGVSDEEDAGN